MSIDFTNRQSTPSFMFAMILSMLLSGLGTTVHATSNIPPLWDTAWTLNLSPQSTIDSYLQARKSQGFDVVLMGFGYFGTRNTAIGNGESPFLGTVSSDIADVRKPNEAAWRYVDNTISIARSKGLTVGFLPLGNGGATSYVAALQDRYSGENRAYKYGVWLGKRYKNTPNIIWMLGGDVNPNDDLSIVSFTNNLANGIRSTGDTHPMTYHPSNNIANGRRLSSSIWFNNQSWLTYNGIQSTPVIDTSSIRYDLSLTPSRQTGIQETRYESSNYGAGASSREILEGTWLTYLNGASYMTYGQAGMYQGQNAASTDGIKYSKIARNELVSRNWLSYIPTRDFISSSDGTTASMRKGNSAAMIYLGSGASVTVKMSSLNAAANVAVQLLDPARGSLSTLGIYAANGTQSFSGGGLNNAVLLFDSTDGTDTVDGTTNPPPTTTQPSPLPPQ
jgi:hypothetical protein